MRAGRASRTAQFVAAARGLGLLLPDDVRIADDPYGVAFSSPGLARLIERGQRPEGRAFATMPGLRTWIVYMQVRTRLLDDAVRAFTAAGGRQVVLLGAGYDCRALRLRELVGSAVFEVDHPATQGHKRGVLARIHAESPAKYVTWDFEARPMAELPEALAAAGHDAGAPTLTIWEGVTMYLTEGAIDASLRAIRAWSAPRSQLAMTYFAKKRLDQPSLATRAVAAVVARLGEPWKWGWIPDELPAYLRTRGFELVRDVSAVEAAHELLPADLASAIRAADSRVAIAVQRQ
ncbi:MAG: SAM-dependent methyltransferase [Deltaproteobacteria bacterium]|nr:SAM-dependent methyltransferase [Deltaproteobacteria bacterium]